MSWYKESKLKKEIENLIMASQLYKKDFEKSKNPAKAQLWIVTAILYKEINELKREIELLKETLKSIKLKKEDRKVKKKKK